jgi:hypothetical protein
VNRSATTTSALRSCSYIGTSMAPECRISSARRHSSPFASTTGLIRFLYDLSRSSFRPVAKSVFTPKPITTKQRFVPPLAATNRSSNPASAAKARKPSVASVPDRAAPQGEQAITESRFDTAKALFGAALQLGKPGGQAEGAALLHDPYLHQLLVLATYKAKQPNEGGALDEALRLLAPLQPEVSNDPETVGLAGAIEKRLFDQGRGAEHLNRAIRYYRRGYYLRDEAAHVPWSIRVYEGPDPKQSSRPAPIQTTQGQPKKPPKPFPLNIHELVITCERQPGR